MAFFVALLRGINVGGHRVTNDTLAAEFAALGLGDPRAFLASGNVVFEADGRTGDLETTIEGRLGSSLGYGVPAFVRTADQIRKLATTGVFTEAHLTAGGKSQVIFVREPLSVETRQQVSALAVDDEHLAPADNVVHWLPAAGVSDSPLDLKALESLTGLHTIRSRTTVERIAARFFG
jgi:uncharacterized protein (DUF1697 family)